MKNYKEMVENLIKISNNFAVGRITQYMYHFAYIYIVWSVNNSGKKPMFKSNN